MVFILFFGRARNPRNGIEREREREREWGRKRKEEKGETAVESVEETRAPL